MKNKLTSDRLEALREDINKALKPVAERYGLQTLILGRCQYSRDLMRATFKLDAVVAGGLSAEQQAYDSLRGVLRPTLPERGTVITLKGKQYEVYGMKPRGRLVMLRKVGEEEARYTLPITAVEDAAKASAKPSNG